MRNILEYQQDGFVSGSSTKSLSEANRQIAVAKRATPDEVRDKFKSGIRFIKRDNGYLWVWHLK